MFRAVRVPARIAFRRYASEAEYKSELSQSPEVGQIFQGKEPFLCHFTHTKHAQLEEHNKMVDEVMGDINKGDVLIKYLVAGTEQQITLQLMQSLQIKQAPAMAAFADGKLLDISMGLSDKEKFQEFMKRFLSYTGKGDIEGNPEMDDIEGDDAVARFARFILENQKNKKPAEQIVSILKEIIDLAETEIKEERKNKKPAQKKDTTNALPTATKTEQAAASALLVLAEQYQEMNDSAKAVKTIETVKRSYGRFKIPAVVKSLNILEMSILTNFDGKPAVEHARLVAADPANLVLQLRLAVAMFKEGKFKESTALMLQVLRKDKTLEDGLPKKLLVASFAVLGKDNDITKEGQKKMMSYLF
eukprot:TRINITY_DN3161_c6_g1_i1.p1 TRINITY_DN3161_c6_g1~~TRINITY_DN3161_c6_g1_i1.p1  ORF type:complete len:379 (+),score=111.47 TRINITY_DN3161_c6_g1_i1:60-1139(+)